MINKLLSISLILIATASTAIADNYVNGYPRRDGTYVAPHYRSSPDSSYNNNWSVSPNINPYTGQQSSRSPTWNNQSPSFNSPNSNYRPSYPRY